MGKAILSQSGATIAAVSHTMRARFLLLAAACASLLVAPPPAAGRELRGSVQILAKGGKFIDKSADVRTAVVVFRPKVPVRGLSTSRSFSMTTRKKEFVPRVLAVPVGATVLFPNEDPILHNVFSVSGENRFDLGLYRQGKGKPATFKSPGIVRVFCNVHQSMVGFIAVLDSPFSAFPDSAGNFSLTIPDGAGTIEVWHEQTEPVTLEVPAGPLRPDWVLRPIVTRPRVPQHLNKLGKPYDRGRADYN
jgi:plastocyanin